MRHRGLFHRPRLPRRHATRGQDAEEGEEDDDEGSRPGGPQGLRRRPQQQQQRRRRRGNISDYSDDDCVKYFVLGTVAALLALALNLIYPLLYQASRR